MTHQDALNSKAVERYHLKEMDVLERDEFEEHWFDGGCSICSDALIEYAMLQDNIAAVCAEDKEEELRKKAPKEWVWWKPRSWPIWLSF